MASYKVPVSLTEVENVISAVSSINATNKDSDFIQDQINRLETIKGIVETQEKQFYKMLGVNENNVTEGLRHFQRLINDTINNSGIKYLINFEESDLASVSSQINNKVIINSFDKFFGAELRDPAISGAIKEAVTKGGDTVEAFVRALKGGEQRFNFIGGEGKAKKGLARYIAEAKWSEKEDPHFSIRLAEDIPQKYVKRLQEQYQVDFPELNQENILLSNIKAYVERVVTDPEMKRFIVNELITKYSERFNVNRSSGSIKGILGELAYNAILYKITKVFPNATGAVRKIVTEGKGQEIPIDIMLKNFGFQVKNYQIINNEVSFGHKKENDVMGMGNFIINRLRPKEGIKKILVELFGSLQYNQIYKDSAKFAPVRAELESVVGSEDIEKIFESYADNIIKLSDKFQANDSFFGKERTYYNTFFLIRDKVVPSSAILKALIRQLRRLTNNTKRVITSSFTIQGKPKSDGIRYPEKKQSSIDALDTANNIKINYSISLNLENILSEAMAYAT